MKQRRKIIVNGKGGKFIPAYFSLQSNRIRGEKKVTLSGHKRRIDSGKDIECEGKRHKERNESLEIYIQMKMG